MIYICHICILGLLPGLAGHYLILLVELHYIIQCTLYHHTRALTRAFWLKIGSFPIICLCLAKKGIENQGSSVFVESTQHMFVCVCLFISGMVD